MQRYGPDLCHTCYLLYLQKRLFMRGIASVILCVALLSTGCFKQGNDCPYSLRNITAPASEEQAVLSYLTANNITATKHGSNLYYEVVTPGTGATPQMCSSVLIKYNGKLSNGTLFDNQENAIYTLGSLIEGWKIGLSLIKKGGQIRLYIPPTLGYGNVDVKDNNGTVIIPANSILIFDIVLKDVQ